MATAIPGPILVPEVSRPCELDTWPRARFHRSERQIKNQTTSQQVVGTINTERTTMKINRRTIGALALIPAVMLALAAQGQPGGEQPTPKKRGGAVIEVESVSATATVTAVDATKRTV